MNSTRHYIGLDVGTSGIKGLLVDESGTVVREASSAYPLFTPNPGWVEQNPEDWWKAARKVLRTLSRAARGNISGIGLSGQMHGTVFLDSSGKPLYPAILWNDQRTIQECEEILQRTEGRIREWTCNPPRTAFSASKILWFRKHHPQLYGQISKVLLPKDFIRFCLSKTFVTDVTDASGTNLLDVRNRTWSKETLRSLDIPESILCDLAESPDVCSYVSKEAARGLGIPEHTPIVGGAADQAASAIGNGVCSPGTLSVTLGSSGVLYVQTEGVIIDPTEALHTFCHSVPRTYQLMGGVLSAAGSLHWFRRTLGRNRESFSQLLEQAKQVPPGSEGLLFLPYLTGERSPYNDPLARGCWFGLTIRHTRAHLIRALLEGVSYALHDLLNSVKALHIPIKRIHFAGGGAKDEFWAQMVSDVFGEPLYISTVKDSSAYGAAMLAASGVSGISLPAISSAWWAPEKQLTPNLKIRAVYTDGYQVYHEMYKGTSKFMHQLAALEGQIP